MQTIRTRIRKKNLYLNEQWQRTNGDSSSRSDPNRSRFGHN